MPAKDIYHDAVRNALIKDGWTITHDPLRVVWGTKDAFVDLGAEQFIGADRNGRFVAFEIKSFSGQSLINDLEKSLGQYLLYYSMMKRSDTERVLYLAIDNATYVKVFEESIGSILLEDYPILLVVFDAEKEIIVKWIP